MKKSPTLEFQRLREEAARRGESTIAVPKDLAEALQFCGEDPERLPAREQSVLSPLKSAAPYRVTE